MPVKKHIRPGKIEASPNGDALVVNFTSEVTHLDEDGMPISVEKTLDKREVPVGQAMRGLTTSEDIRSLAREIVEKCRYIPESKTSQVEKVLNKIYALQTGVPFKDFAPGTTKSSTNRTTGGDSVRPSQLEDLLPFASARNVDDYIDELYEDEMEMKVQGARKLLRICTEVPVLEQLADHSTLLGAKSLQTAQAQAPTDSDLSALGPLLSEAEKEEKNEKGDKGDGAKEKKVDSTQIDYIGCIIPQWSDGDWTCAEAAEVPDTQIYDDAQSRTRKKLREGDVCTVQCPDPRYWQKPEPASLVCKSGRWRDEVTRINVKKIRCETAGRWVFLMGTLVISLPLCCGCCALCACMRMRKKKDPAAPAAVPPAQQATAEAQDPAAPAVPPAAQPATAEAEAPK